MKNYNLKNYIRYKNDLGDNFKSIECWKKCSRDELIIMLMPYAESIARKFSTADKASGVMSISDLIQEANLSLISAVDRINWDLINEDDDIEIQIKGFVKKRIKGSIRRSVDAYRGDIRIPEHKLNEIRRNDDDAEKVKMFFDAIFLSIDEDKQRNKYNNMEDKSKRYNIALLNEYIFTVMESNLNDKEYEIIRMSYGLDCDKKTAKEIAKELCITGVSDYVRVSQIKKQAIQKLIDNIDFDKIVDYL